MTPQESLKVDLQTGNCILVNFASLSDSWPESAWQETVNKALFDLLGKRPIDGFYVDELLDIARRTDAEEAARIAESAIAEEHSAVAPDCENLIDAPVYRVYDLSYLKPLFKAADARGSDVQSLSAHLEDVRPVEERLQVIGLSDLLFSRTLSSASPTSMRAWRNELVADATTRPVIALVDEVGASESAVLSSMSEGSRGKYVVPLGGHRSVASLAIAGWKLLSPNVGELTELLRPNLQHIARGHARIAQQRDAVKSTKTFQLVSQRMTQTDDPGDEFLRGFTPTWVAVASRDFVKRKLTEELFGIAKLDSVSIIRLRGAAGCGKTGTAMQLALALALEGHAVGWVDRRYNSKLRDLRKAIIAAELDYVFIDDVDNYGDRAAAICQEFSISGRTVVVAIARASRDHILRDLTGPSIRVVDHPAKLDEDEARQLLKAIANAGLLNFLREEKSETERIRIMVEECGADLLAILIKVVTGEQLNERVRTEYEELGGDPQQIYKLVCFLSSVVYESIETATTDLIQISTEEPPYGRSLAAIEELEQARLIRETDSAIAARHRVIAERVLRTLPHSDVVNLLFQTAKHFAYRSKSNVDSTSSESRHTIRLISHNVMKELNLTLPEARAVYKRLQEDLDDNFHFWLQRGAYELDCGSLDYADNYTTQAKACEGGAGDFKVATQAANVAFRIALENGSENAIERGLREFDDLVRAAPKWGSDSPHSFTTLGRVGLKFLRLATERGFDPVDRWSELKHTLQIGKAACAQNAQVNDAFEAAMPVIEQFLQNQVEFPL